MVDNNSKPIQLPDHVLPVALEPAQCVTFQPSGTRNIVLVISAPGRMMSVGLAAADAIRWGDQLSQAGRVADLGIEKA